MNLYFFNKLNYNKKIRILRWLIYRINIQKKERERMQREKVIINQIYNDIYLEPIQKINMSNMIIKTIHNNDYYFFTSNSCIIKHPYEHDKYIINIRWINYKLDNNGKAILHYPKNISLNSCIILDKLFNKIGKEKFLNNTEDYSKPFNNFGIEDVRIFNYSDKLYYIGSTLNETTNTIAITSNEYSLNADETRYEMNKKIIIPSFYNDNRIEKNWCFFEYKQKMCFVYKWYPVTICQIDYNNNKLNLLECKVIKNNFFKNVRGSTSGVLFNNEIWFLLHKSINNDYLHFFAVFDIDMNLVRYSHLFKFNKCKIEYCIGFIIENDRTILSFSSLDTSLFIGIYDNNYIKSLKWNTSNYFI